MMRIACDPGSRPYVDSGSQHGCMTWHVCGTPFVSKGALQYLLMSYVGKWS